MTFKQMLRKYQLYLNNNKIKLPVSMWFLVAVIFSAVAFSFVYLVFENLVLSAVVFFGVLDIIIGMPIFIEEQRINEIEKNIPNALREMADILKSGGTYEYALREITSLNYGQLSKEFEKVLIRLEEGSNLEDALHVLIEDVDSDLVHKVIGIVVDSISAGAGLADILEEISEDARQIYKLEQDRKAKTTMQVLFIFAAGGLIAPAIFGLVMTIVEFLINVSSVTGVADSEAVGTAMDTKSLLFNVVTIYIFLEAVASSFMVTMMRDKRLGKVMFYLPIFLLMGFIAFYVAMYFTKGLLSGMV